MRLAFAQVPAREAEPPRRLPWTYADLQRLVRTELLSFLGLVVCFVGARNTRAWDDQLLWIVGALAAMLLAGWGWTGWMLAGSRALRARERAALARGGAIAARRRRRSHATGLVVTAAGMRHFHRPDCVFARDRPTTAATAEASAAQGLIACGACRP
ncbi:MAG TPA: hypothetical protein VHE83_07485 [Mycobacteriales bacterium]|nr:hypothetical protein [Mycobacteriales bacterium]